MGSLTPADVKRWDLNAIHTVFETASGRANTLQHLGDSLQQAHNVLADWQGEAGDAFRGDVGKIRRDIEADGAESKQVAAAVSRAEADVSACKRELDDVERAAQANGWFITPDWRIDVGAAGIPANRIDLATQLQILQGELNTCKVHAHTADHELATAIGAAVGAVPLDAAGSPGGAAPPQGQPQTWKDMLMPPGAAEAPPAGVPPSDPSAPAVPGGKPKTWRDMLLPAGAADPGQDGVPPKGSPTPVAAGPGGIPPKGPSAPAGAGGQPRTLRDMLLPAGGVPLPQPSPAEMENARAIARRAMIADGVPPDQVEAKLDDLVAGAQRWIDEGGIPPYIAPEPKPPPPPGFGEGFADRWFATEQGIHNLLGVGGPGAPGVFQSWQQMLSGTVETALNPAGAAIGEAQNALNSPSPAYFLGGKAADGAIALPGLLFGGEGAAVRAGLPAETVTAGGAPLAVVRGWHPTGGMPWEDFASQFGTPELRSYPLNDGFPSGYVPQPAHLPEGTIIDRFGSPHGRYLAPDGTPFADRALAPESVGGDYNRYMVTGKPLPPGWQVVEGPVQPYYGQTPSTGSRQYMVLGPDGVKPSVWELVRLGILDEYGPPLGR
ncbi:TNT domain-containing protein [Mycobacterium sp. Aquia_216]|uniref:TNT domain-containing protein n=1 Tax=Mycobacterium sp. Aquia_216 TaxID=2991729 RepID=UPI00227B3544|nr:TNT domain-containing protein [Mycobacterium sp. Aquia_216]WAJ46664.1 TNT domain-containing protein [Mycobacterium sp. Aquia_216]